MTVHAFNCLFRIYYKETINTYVGMQASEPYTVVDSLGESIEVVGRDRVGRRRLLAEYRRQCSV